MSRETVIRRIIDRETQNCGLTEELVLRDAPELHRSACEHFGTWDTALKYSGIGVRRLYSQEDYSRKCVLQRIRRHREKGHNPTAAYIQHVDPRLYHAAQRYFGRWQRAVHAAGVRIQRSRLQKGQSRRLNRDNVLETIQNWNADGYSLDWTDLYLENRALADAATIIFGSWQKALEATNIGPDSRKRRQRYRRWNKNTVIEHLRSRQQDGKSLTCQAVLKDDSGLFSAAIKHFGKWSTAKATAGIGSRSPKA